LIRVRAIARRIRNGIVWRAVDRKIVRLPQAAVDREIGVISIIERARELRISVEGHPWR